MCPRQKSFDVARARATDGGPLPAAKIGKCIFVKGPRARSYQGRGGLVPGFTFFTSKKVKPLINNFCARTSLAQDSQSARLRIPHSRAVNSLRF